MEIIFADSPSWNEFDEALKKLSKEAADSKNTEKLEFVFSKPVDIRFAGAKTKFGKNKISLKIFSGCKGWGYTQRSDSHSGTAMSCFPWYSVRKIVLPDKKEINWEKESRLMRGRIHPNAWADLQDKLSDDGTYLREHLYGNLSVISIASRFPGHVITSLRKAFEEKTQFSYRTYGDKRDLTVETKLCEDGIFRAWYSSEYSGCGNGSYYLLLNPTTAAFKEDD